MLQPLCSPPPCQVLRRASAYRVPLYVTETGVSIAGSKERCYTIDAYVKEVGAMRGGHVSKQQCVRAYSCQRARDTDARPA